MEFPIINPSNDPATVPGNSSLARPLADPSYLCELTIKNESNLYPIFMATYLDTHSEINVLGLLQENH